MLDFMPAMMVDMYAQMAGCQELLMEHEQRISADGSVYSMFKTGQGLTGHNGQPGPHVCVAYSVALTLTAMISEVKSFSVVCIAQTAGLNCQSNVPCCCSMSAAVPWGRCHNRAQTGIPVHALTYAYAPPGLTKHSGCTAR